MVTLFHVLSNTFGAAITGVSVAALALVQCLGALLLVAVLGGDHLARATANRHFRGK